MVAPNADTFSRSWLVGFHYGLVLELVEPFVNGFFGVVRALVVLCGEDLETRVRFWRYLLEEQALLNFACLNGIFLFWTDNGYACTLFQTVTYSFDYGFLRAYYGEVNLVFVGFCELADCVDS